MVRVQTSFSHSQHTLISRQPGQSGNLRIDRSSSTYNLDGNNYEPENHWFSRYFCFGG